MWPLRYDYVNGYMDMYSEILIYDIHVTCIYYIYVMRARVHVHLVYLHMGHDLMSMMDVFRWG